MNYRSVADLNLDIKKWITRLPNDLDIIVGIPRSGLLVANLIALHSNLPMTDVEGLCAHRVLNTGTRYNNGKGSNLFQINKILIVDDSVCSGRQMQIIKNRLKKAKCEYQIYYAAVYISPQGYKHVNFWYEIVDLPRVFEWNVMHHSILANSCVDIDGVLCPDPTNEENDDGEDYIQFLKNVKPLIIPTKTIGWLVTCRLEKYRKLTEEWLGKYNIRYKNLVMMNLPNKEARVASGSHANYKARVYKKFNANLFIESSLNQAREIVRLTGKPALCVETGEMLNPGHFAIAHNLSNKFSNKFIHNPFKAIYKLARFLIVRIRVIKWKIIAKKRENN